VTRFAGKRSLITGAGAVIGAAVVTADIAGTDVHLDVRSDAASFVTGRVLVIDGGLTDA
jgi:hypothetical protein